jgi:hypothetical protein
MELCGLGFEAAHKIFTFLSEESLRAVCDTWNVYEAIWARNIIQQVETRKRLAPSAHHLLVVSGRTRTEGEQTGQRVQV